MLYSQTEMLSWKIQGLSGIVQNDISRMLENGEMTIHDLIASRTYTGQRIIKMLIRTIQPQDRYPRIPRQHNPTEPNTHSDRQAVRQRFKDLP